MPPILGGYGDTETRDIMGGTQSTYQPPAPQPYTYVAPAGALSGVPAGTTFTGEEAKRVEAYVAGVEYEQAVYEANNPEQTIYDRITTANAETVNVIQDQIQTAIDTTQTVADTAADAAASGASFLGKEILPVAAVVGALLLLR